LWPTVIAAASKALSAPLSEVFGPRYVRDLSTHSPLTLMQADPTYCGHDRHTHFYHCPHWAFTMLLYVDPDDIYSRGTGIHQLLPANGDDDGDSSYRVSDLDYRVDVAMDTLNWFDGYGSRRYRDGVVDYRASRLFVFLDGPLAFHTVPFDNPDHQPDPQRALDNGSHARRRILRSHMRIEGKPFFAGHSARLSTALDLKRHAQVMAPNSVLSTADQQYRDAVLRPFYHERLQAYARATEAVRSPAIAGRESEACGEAFYAPRRFTVEVLQRRLMGWQ
jgi:hypothetical protein